MLQINIETGNVEVAQPSNGDNQKWTFKPSCEVGVVLTNIATSATSSWIFSPDVKTLWNENGFAQNTKRKGLIWAAEVQYLRGTTNPWLYMQWEIVRAQLSNT